MNSDYPEINLPNYEDIPESEHSAMLKVALDCCALLKQELKECRQQLNVQSEQLQLQAEQLNLQAEQIDLQSEQIQMLKDEIAVLKGEKPRPEIKSSTLNKDKDDTPGSGGTRGGKKKRKRGKPSRKKTRELEIHEEIILQPENIPEGSIFKGYEDYIVQDIEIKPKNTKYRRARYETPEGESLYGQLPESAKGSHFGPVLKSYILSQHYECHVTQPLLLKQLWSFGIMISAGQLGRIITERHDGFHKEKSEILRTGLEVSSYINVDDTGARHQGKNGVSTHIGNQLFAWFSSTQSKSRVNFLDLLRAGHTDYVIDTYARKYMKQQKLPKLALELLCENRVFLNKDSWEVHLKSLGIKKTHHIRIATEGALVASIVARGLALDLVILSDDAGQFRVTGFLNALCWVHAERTINKIIGYSDNNREILKTVQDQIWNFYQRLKEFKAAPNFSQRIILENAFDEIFTQKTSFQTLNLALGRIHKNKKQLLLVLERPEIPLHNNLSENDIRDYVKKRKISASTRSEDGRQSRDTFLSLKKTCQKLGISFWEFLQDRLSRKNNIPPLPELIRIAAASP